MIGTVLKKIFGTANERYLKRKQPIVAHINSLEGGMKALSDAQLKAKTAEFKQKLANGATLDDILPEVFAVVRETSRRTLNMRHFDVQLIGGMVLHEGIIAEMRTGEGKTLVATLPLYLNALEGKGVHLVTVNDYLAKRDAEWMGKIYNFLGMDVGVIVHGLTNSQRRKSYNADITYGYNSEFGFDYLRDNMKFALEDYVQRDLNYAIVDEVDSILIDEARTPLIISSSSEEAAETYYKVDAIMKHLTPSPTNEEEDREKGDFWRDEEGKSVMLTEKGVEKVEQLLGVKNLYDPSNIELLHHVNNALRAHFSYKRDVDYMVKEGKVYIVDEFTGRIMPGRRWSDGLHQAIEAKEKVEVEAENQTVATITYQNYFRMYKKLAGMTGTAATEAKEFAEIYNLDVIVVPTNKPVIRIDYEDAIYKNEEGKFRAVVEEIRDCNKRGQPVLVGTVSVEKSEKLSAMLQRAGLKHNVLNAKFHQREAEIVAQAGRKGAITIATNMAGRGTDILLGGNPEAMAKADTVLWKAKMEEPPEGEGAPPPVKVSEEEEKKYLTARIEEYKKISEREREDVLAAGGLHIIGTERHEARRIDNQLRGRSGRQGDPGSSRFYIALDDDLMRIFGGDRLKNIMETLGMEEGQAIEHKMVSRSIEKAQERVEARNFDIRKNLLEYDDVMNQQRKTIYSLRRDVLSGEKIHDKILDIADDLVQLLVGDYCNPKLKAEDWDILQLEAAVREIFGINIGLKNIERSPEKIQEAIYFPIEKILNDKIEKYGEEVFNHAEKVIYLQTIDRNWKDHLTTMDYLRQGIGLRGYGQRDPKIEYKKEGYNLFLALMSRIKQTTLQQLLKIEIQTQEEIARIEAKERAAAQKIADAAGRDKLPIGGGTVKRTGKKIKPNDPCWCGSGKKYKKCHGRPGSTQPDPPPGWQPPAQT
ncbi:MAG: preprotein translocase subunit SecA [Myxococcota bacterium]